MSLPDTFMLGHDIGDIATLDDLGITTGDPDATYKPFSVIDKLGDLTEEGNGFETVTWHYAGMEIGEADVLYDFLGGNISAPVVFRSRLNRLNMGRTDYLWKTFSGIMSWMSGEEDNPALHTLNVTIIFNRLEEVPGYP